MSTVEQATLDSLFGAMERTFSIRFNIFFDAEPTLVTDADYIIDYDVSEAVWDDENGVLGGPEPAKLSLTLLNEDNRFTPSNDAGPYANKIITGIKIVGDIQVHALGQSSGWLPIGIFYVTDWKATIGTSEVQVSASDTLQGILDANTTAVEVVERKTYSEFIQYYFDQIQHEVVIEDTLGSILPFGWSEGDAEDDLHNILNAARAVCACSRTDKLHVYALAKQRVIRDTLTDASELFVSAEDKSTIVQQYRGVKLTYSKPKLIADSSIVDLRDQTVAPGSKTLDPLKFSSSPVYAVESVGCQTEATRITIDKYSYTPHEITIDVTNTGDTDANADILVRGTVVEFTDTLIADDTEDLLEFESELIQTAVYASSYKQFLSKFVSSKRPTLSVKTTGNMAYGLLDRIVLSSEKYAVTFDGIITRIETSYSGGLSQVLTLTATSILAN